MHWSLEIDKSCLNSTTEKTPSQNKLTALLYVWRKSLYETCTESNTSRSKSKTGLQ